MKKYLLFSLSLLFFNTILAQTDILKVMYYNTLNYPTGGDPNREDHFRTVNQYLQADVILINELTSESGAYTLLNDALNVYGTTYYQKAAYTDGPDTDNMLFYNSDKLVLYSQWYIPTSLRHINEYVLYYKSEDLALGSDTIFFYFYSAHLKAFPEDSLQRLSEVNSFLSRLNSLSNAENVFFGGDMNIYTDDEPGYQALINNSPIQLIDPLPAGNWHANYTYRYYHTQSTRTSSFGGGSTGGLDDRFDMILFTDDVLNGTNGVEYISGSCEAFGNDGLHYNDALIDLPLNPYIPDSVTYALYYMSDHLPVICDLQIAAAVDTTTSNIVITEIMYNPPEAGTDSLEFIEVYNNGSEVADLTGYFFSSGVDFTFPNFTLDPGDFALVGINSDAMYNTFGVDAFQWTGGLSNNGELIMLNNPSGILIDSVFYDDGASWPPEADGDGPSIILCDPNSDNSLGENWDYSQNFVTYNDNGEAIYASPGFSECDFPPVANFLALPVQVFTGESVSFTDLSVNNPTSWNWTFPGGSPMNSVMQNPIITYNVPGVYNVELTVSNSSGSNTAIFEDYISVMDESPVLMVTEIMQNPSSVSDEFGEWFEVFNPTSSPVDMNGWYIKDNDYDSIRINSSVVVPSYGFATLGRNTDTEINGNYLCSYAYSNFFLSNGSDEIVLFNPGNEEVDRVEYDGGPNWPDPNGLSMIFTGDFSMDNNDSNNWETASLREDTYSGSLTDKGSPGTNGTGQNLEPLGFGLDVKVYLQGPYDGSVMNTTLNAQNLLPLDQPFNVAPWNYNGNETVISIPNSEVVDWILVELRDAADVSLAQNGSMIAQKAAFLLNNGQIVDLDGLSNIPFDNSISQNLFVVIHHRNHIEIISANALSKSAGIYHYDFTTSSTQAYEDGQLEIASGVWGMIAADSDASGLIDEADKDPHWNGQSGNEGYLKSDANLDTQVNNKDKNDFWFPNQGAGSQVPD